MRPALGLRHTLHKLFRSIALHRAKWTFVLVLLSVGVVWGCHYDFSVHQRETICNDGQDNDGDGFADCMDIDCASNPVCLGETDCSDHVDNDGNGLTDCDDSDCDLDPACAEVDCADGIDDDGDGATDCDDSDCTDSLECMGPHPCNEDSICDPPYEDRRWCSDCLPQCSLDEGHNSDFIVTALTIPRDSTEAQQMGVDLDGDGDIDNNLGGLMALAASDQQADSEASIAEKIQDGRFIMLVRILADQWPNDDTVTVQVFDGDLTDDATEDNLTGHGSVQISPTAPRTDMMCGNLSSPTLVAGPGTMRLPLPIFRKVIYITTTSAWVVTGNQGSVTQDSLTDVIVAGGWTKDTIDYEVAPELAHYLTVRYLEDPPDSSFRENVDTQVDGHCTNIIPGCEDVVNGEGECVPWDGDPNTPVVTATEVRCSALATYIQPTLDLDGDGKADIFPVGIRISAVPVTIEN